MKPSAIALFVVLAAAHAEVARAQSDQERTLRQQVEQRFEVLPLQNGVVLRPRATTARARAVEITDGTIVIDGSPATGAELREKLGTDADLVLRLSYLDRVASQRLFGGGSTGSKPAAPLAEQPEPPTPPVPPPVPPEPPAQRPRRPLANGGDLVRFGSDITVEEGDVVAGDAVALGGKMRVDGEVTGNAVVIGGDLELGPRANIHGDSVNIGGSLKRDPSATIGGNVVDLGGVGLNLRTGRGRFQLRRLLAIAPFGAADSLSGMAEKVISLVATIARILVLSVLASFVLLFGRQYVDRAAEEAWTRPLKAGAIGFVAQLLVIPVFVVAFLILIVTIVGIPLLVLLPFALLALALVGLVGFTAIAYLLGGFVNRRFGWPDRSPYLTAVTGVVVLVSPVLIARLAGLAGSLLSPLTAVLVVLGFLVEYVAWTVGFGAVTLLRFGRPKAPSLPAAATPVI